MLFGGIGGVRSFLIAPGIAAITAASASFSETLPKAFAQLTSSQAMEYSRRLEAIASKTGPMANLPKGPLPKGARQPRMPKPR